MKVTHDKVSTPPARSYPYIGQCEDAGPLVLFTSEGCGTVLIPSTEQQSDFGTHAVDWSEKLFTPLPAGDTVTLSN